MRTIELATALLILTVSFASAVASETPRRVVSMNLCTDQLALLLAAPGQLLSVSYLSHKPETSVLAVEAQRLPANHGLAEEIFLLQPDLVLAGTFTSRASVEMLKRLGFRVEQFAPDYSFADLRSNILRMGQLLGRVEQAQDMVSKFDADLARLRASASGTPPLGATYYAGGRTSGRGTLTDEIMTTAGWRNLAAELGIRGTGVLPLELLVLNRPDKVIGSANYVGKAALAHQNYRHPALLAAVRSGTGVTSLPDRFSVCGGPFTTEAVRLLVAERGSLTPVPGEAR